MVSIFDLVNAVVGANGNLPLATERLKKRLPDDAQAQVFETDGSTLLAILSSDPQAPELIAKQFRMRATLTTFSIMHVYQASMLEQATNEKRPMSPDEITRGFNAVSTMFGTLTQGTNTQVNINVMDKIMSMVDPEVREAITVLAQKDPLLPPPTPIRKRGRPPGSHNYKELERSHSASDVEASSE